MSKAEIQAHKLINDLAIEHPIEPEAVCKLLSSSSHKILYETIPLSSKEICGIINTLNGETYISINSNINRGRQLFTFAHEIGHFVLHIENDSRKQFDCSKHDINQFRFKKVVGNCEIEANQFAIALLMPANQVRELIRRKEITWDLIRKIAITFQVSLEAAARRIVNLTREPCVFVVHTAETMWTPVSLDAFPAFFSKTTFPKNLCTIKDCNNDKLLYCDPSIWGIDIQDKKYKCRYTTLHQTSFNKYMSIIYLEEVEA